MDFPPTCFKIANVHDPWSPMMEITGHGQESAAVPGRTDTHGCPHSQDAEG